MIYSVQCNNFELEIDQNLNYKSHKIKLLVILEFVKPLFWKNGNEAMKQPNRVNAFNE